MTARRLPAQVSWPVGALQEALGRLGRVGGAAGLAPDPADEDGLDRYIARAAAEAGLDAQRVAARGSDVGEIVARGAPAIWSLGDGQLVVLVRSGRRSVDLLGRDLRRVRVPAATLTDALRAPAEAGRTDAADRAVARLPARRREAARRLVLDRLSASEQANTAWLLRAPPDGAVWASLREHGLLRAVPAWLLTHGVAYGLWLLSWWVVGRGALAGRLEPGWLLGWAAILVSLAPLRGLTVWLQGRIAVRAGVILRQRLVLGALRMSPDDVRTRGVGTLLGRVEESAALERLALDGGLSALLSGVEWVVATAVLAAAGATLHAALGAAWLLAIGAVAVAMHRDRAVWTAARVAGTHALVEQLIGHRTRAVQAAPEGWHGQEDEALARYADVSRRADRSAFALHAVTTSWMACGIVALGPSFVAGAATPTSLAVAIGGVLLVARALDGVSRGLADLVEAAVAWEQVRDVLAAARRTPSVPAPEVASLPAALPEDPVLQARGVAFRYAGAPRPALAAVDLRIGRKDRVLVQGTSGGGKSTLGSLILGLRTPTAGILLLDGLDRASWGDAGWRDRVTGAPQFHENHVLAGTLAFNLLLGRRWPPRPEDLDDAEAICHQLGLGPLVERMPAGLQQIVGETGWQLSHGERSRVYLARALLQEGQLLVLDETFGALDAASTEWCLYRANAHPGALVVIAHP